MNSIRRRLLVILLAARGVMANKIFRVTLWMQVFLAAFVFLSAAVGFIIDLRFERGGIFNRHALGYWFPSYIMSYYFFVLLLLFWTRKKPMKPTSVALLEDAVLLRDDLVEQLNRVVRMPTQGVVRT